jgi:hypothetical protein
MNTFIIKTSDDVYVNRYRLNTTLFYSLIYITMQLILDFNCFFFEIKVRPQI